MYAFSTLSQVALFRNTSLNTRTVRSAHRCAWTAPQTLGCRSQRVPLRLRGGAGPMQMSSPSSSSSSAAAQQQQGSAGQEFGPPCFLHAVYRVGDLNATIQFYKEALGMQLLRYRDLPEKQFANAFLGYGDEREGFFSMELTQNYGVDHYNIGDAFGHFAIATPDVRAMAERVRRAGGRVTREPGPVKGGTSVIAFIEDPDGYKFELIEREQRDPLCQVMLRVGNLERALDFYQRALGMQKLRTRRNEDGKYTLGFVGYGAERESTVVELTENDGRTEYEHGDGYAQVALATDDVFRAGARLREAGANMQKEPGEVPGIGTKIVSALDPDGHKFALVDWNDFLREFA